MSTTGWHPLDHAAIRHARVLPLDVVQAKGAGHAGTAVGLTPALYVLFQEVLRHDPNCPTWEGRDRFVLSAGHASLALYVQLYLCGYGLEMEDLRQARTLGSRTPGHPEWGHTPGVETTTGPLGQGVANAVGMAMATRRTAELLQPETPREQQLFATRVWCLASDGDLQEGISHEASSLAGTLALDGLVLIWDDNGISIEGDTAIAFSEDVCARYRAYGWHVVEVHDAEDPAELRRGYAEAAAITGRPVLVRLRTRIGHPMPNIGGTARAHSGAPGSDEVAATKECLGLDPAVSFAMPAEALQHARTVAERGTRLRQEWQTRVSEWQAHDPQAAALLDCLRSQAVSPEVQSEFDILRSAPRPAATRIASAEVLNAVSQHLPWLWGGSADLAESNGVAIANVRSFTPANMKSEQWPGGPDGSLVHFGIREHAMGAILNGIALGGTSVPFGATFFVFSDYLRPAVRLAALMNLRTIYVWTHDSVAVGEDGPTHQPVEQLWSNRSIPGLSVVRPADWVETVDAWERIATDSNGPTAMVLSRQTVPVIAAHVERGQGAGLGAYVLSDAATIDAVVIATGSEVAIALDAQQALSEQGIGVRVVSAPCLEWFEMQDDAYRDQVMAWGVPARVSVEAGTATGWYRYLGTYGEAVSIESFGASGDGSLLLQDLGVTVEHVVAAVQRSLERSKTTAV